MMRPSVQDFIATGSPHVLREIAALESKQASLPVMLSSLRMHAPPDIAWPASSSQDVERAAGQMILNQRTAHLYPFVRPLNHALLAELPCSTTALANGTAALSESSVGPDLAGDGTSDVHGGDSLHSASHHSRAVAATELPSVTAFDHHTALHLFRRLVIPRDIPPKLCTSRNAASAMQRLEVSLFRSSRSRPNRVEPHHELFVACIL